MDSLLWYLYSPGYSDNVVLGGNVTCFLIHILCVRHTFALSSQLKRSSTAVIIKGVQLCFCIAVVDVVHNEAENRRMLIMAHSWISQILQDLQKKTLTLTLCCKWLGRRVNLHQSYFLLRGIEGIISTNCDLIRRGRKLGKAEGPHLFTQKQSVFFISSYISITRGSF